MVSGIITGLASKSLKDSKEMSKYQSNEQSLYFCAQCEKLMTLSQSEFISCLETPGNPEQNQIIDLHGSMYFSHNFEVQRHPSVLGEESTLESCVVDTDHFIRWFREKHRLCWKEIYLKLGSIMGLDGKNEAFNCTKCAKWFQMSDIANCSWNDDGSKNFHEISYSSDSKLSQKGFECIKQQVQVIDNRLSSKEINLLMKAHSEIEF